MKARLPECILFDLDGTILDSLPGVEYSVRAAFEACGLTLPQVSLRSMIGPPIRTILSMAGGITDNAVIDALERAFRRNYDAEGWKKTVCFPSAHQVLRQLRSRRHRSFVVSNKPRHISLRILEDEGILDLFEGIVTADSRTPSYNGKGEMINSIFADYGVSAPNCLLVGDTIEDAKAAAEVKVEFIFMRHGYGEVVKTPSLPIAHELDSFSQFLLLVTEEPVCD